MGLEVAGFRESFSALFTYEGLLLSVFPLVDGQDTVSSERLTTFATDIGLLTSMDPRMVPQVAFSRKSFFASLEGTGKGFNAKVPIDMVSEPCFIHVRLVTAFIVALVWLLSCILQANFYIKYLTCTRI